MEAEGEGRETGVMGWYRLSVPLQSQAQGNLNASRTLSFVLYCTKNIKITEILLLKHFPIWLPDLVNKLSAFILSP